MRITKWGEYAILFCIFMAKRNKDMPPAGATEIGGAYDIPTEYAQQILHRLRKGNIIRSIRGPRGGFKLQKSPNETSLKEILYAAEGSTFEIICESKNSKNTCIKMGQSCSLKYVWRDLKNAIDSLLEKTTLSMLVEKQRELSKNRDSKALGLTRQTVLDAAESV